MTKEKLKPIDVSKYIVTESGNVIKDNLKQEAEEWLCNNLHSASEEDFIKAMVDIAEPREKQIEIDAEQIRALQKQNGELTDRVKDLEAQLEREKNLNQCLSDHNEQLRELIEKMKRCEICKHYQGESCNYHSNWVKDCKENGMKLFELKEIKEK